MKAVMKSVSPEICEKLSSGDCEILISKTAPKCDAPFMGYIYAIKIKKRFVRGISTLCNKALYIRDHKLKVLEGWDIMDLNITDISCRADGKVIGEFVCDKVEVLFDTNGNPENYMTDILPNILQKTALSFKEFQDYVGSRADKNSIYGWHISDLTIYDEPKQISDFFNPCPDPYHYCRACKYSIITIPSDEEEYALYHGGHYDYCEEHCGNILRNPPKGWQYVSEDNEE